MKSIFSRPAFILAALGATSGIVGTAGLDFGYGRAPQPGLYMVLAGLWFGVVIGSGVWKFGSRSYIAVATAVTGCWIGWELTVNLAMHISDVWLKPTVHSDTARLFIAGFAAGAVGAFVTWAGAAAFTRKLRRVQLATIVTLTGALFGLLLPLSTYFDHPVVLLAPWQFAVAGILGFGLDVRQNPNPSSLSIDGAIASN